MLRAAMGYLAAADATAMAAEAQAECLLALEEMGRGPTAAPAKVLGAFTAAQGYAADGDYSSRSWLIHRTRSPGVRRRASRPGPPRRRSPPYAARRVTIPGVRHYPHAALNAGCAQRVKRGLHVITQFSQ